MSAIRGTLTVDGLAAVPERVVALEVDLSSVLGGGVVADDGTFEIASAERVSRAVVLACVTDPVVGVAHAVVDVAGGDASVALALDTRAGGVHELSCRVESPGTAPPALTLTADPLALSGVPADLQPHLRRREAAVADAHFLMRRLEGPHFTLLLQEGRWRLDVRHVDRARPNLVRPAFENLVTRLARVDGVEVAAEGPFDGVVVEVTRPAPVTFVLRVLPDDEMLAGG